MSITLLLGIIFGYYLCLHGIYLVLILLGTTQLHRYHQGISFGEFQRIAKSPLTLPFTVIIPAFNEEKVIVNAVLGALNLRYPQHEVIVVNDGSSDKTMPLLIERFGLRLVHKVGQSHFKTQPIRGVYESQDHPKLVVIDKDNGHRADAINAAANLARYPMFCIMDADCVFEEDALLRVIRPFLRSDRIAAAGGIVRPANGLGVKDGRIVSYGIPHRFLPLIQAVEYLRSFQWSRLGLATLNSMLCISGAFLVVRKDVFVDIGGVDPKAITDDIDVTVRLHKHLYKQRGSKRLKIAYIPDPVCYTEVPETVRVLAAQRNRWQRGTLQALLRNWRMTFNPRYGITGLFGMPFFFIFEAFSAIVEGASYVLIAVVYLLGLATLYEVLLFFVLAIVLGTLLSVSAVLLQEFTRLRPSNTRDLVRMLLAGLVENIGYHQLHLFWRIVGTFDYLILRRRDLGLMVRYGSFQH